MLRSQRRVYDGVAKWHVRRTSGAPKALVVALSFCRLLGLGCPKQAFAKIATPRLVLGQVKVDDKSNEITAIPELLTRLDIAGAVITIDAMGCQKKIAEQIVQQKGDYVLSLKGNHGLLHEDVTTYFESSVSPEAAIQTIDGGHGRIETRTLRVSDELDWLEMEHSWTGLKSILAVTAKREVGKKVTEETRYFISSLSADDPGKLEHAVRAHWSIENNLHWVLDVAFDEDSNRTRKGYSAANLAVTRHIALPD